MKVLSKFLVVGVLERGLEMVVGRCGCKQVKEFKYYELDIQGIKGRKEGKGKKGGREGRREEWEGEKEKEIERKEFWFQGQFIVFWF